MKSALRSAAALVLVGWYLMIPPVSDLPVISRGNISILDFFRNAYYAQGHTLGQAMDLMSSGDEEPAFSSAWITMWSFDTLDACESHMGEVVHSFDKIKDKKLLQISPIVTRRAMRFAAANCIASDDPRLAK